MKNVYKRILIKGLGQAFPVPVNALLWQANSQLPRSDKGEHWNAITSLPSCSIQELKHVNLSSITVLFYTFWAQNITLQLTTWLGYVNRTKHAVMLKMA